MEAHNNSPFLGIFCSTSTHFHSTGFRKTLVDSNSLTLSLQDLSEKSIRQLIQNTAARDHMSPVLRSLDWLPVSQMIYFNILLLVYKRQKTLGQKYISDLLHHFEPSRPLRSRVAQYTDSLLLSQNHTAQYITNVAESIQFSVYFMEIVQLY